MIILLIFIIGLCVGSFVNVLIDRLPRGEDVMKGRSHCDYCRHKLNWYELIPLVSWIIQKGKSRCCHKPLSIQYPIIELITALGFVIILQTDFFHFPFSIFHLFSSYLIFVSLLVIFMVDLKHQLIPSSMLILLTIGIIIFVFHYPFSILHSVISAALVFLFFYSIWLFSRGKAMGDGDAPLAFLLSLLTGFPKLIVFLYAAFLTGAITGVILMIVRKKSLKSRMAFGPFLIIGAVIALWQGDLIIRLWNLFI